MSKVFTYCIAAFIFAAALLCLMAAAPVARAQSVFCPKTVTSPSGFATSGIALSGGACTNPQLFSSKTQTNTGAFSGAALAGQAVGNLAQSLSNVETATATQSIEERRATEAATCPPGQTLVDGTCRPPAVAPGPALTPAPAPLAAPAATPQGPRPPVRRASSVAKPAAVPVRKAVSAGPRVRVADQAKPRRVPAQPVLATPPPMLPVLVINQAHYGVWAQGFGDYEERNGRTTDVLQCCASVPGTLLNITASSKTSTEGFLGGVDWTRRDLVYGGDGLILGVMGGYMSSDVKVSSSVLSTVQPSSGAAGAVGNGFGNLRAHLEGPSVGIYATYFNGPWSNDFLVKNDFLSLNETFNDSQAYQVCTCAVGTFVPFTAAFSGTGKASLDDLTISDNLNYKIPINARMWVEPTAGVQYTLSSYSSSAALLGLKDGDLVRLQAGSRLGLEGFLGSTHVTTSVTGLAYDDVLVTGNFIQGGVFGPTSNILNDQGKLRGEGILAVKFDLGQGRSAFVQGDVRGGEDLFGAGGKAGFRLEW